VENGARPLLGLLGSVVVGVDPDRYDQHGRTRPLDALLELGCRLRRVALEPATGRVLQQLWQCDQDEHAAEERSHLRLTEQHRVVRAVRGLDHEQRDRQSQRSAQPHHGHVTPLQPFRQPDADHVSENREQRDAD